MLFCHPATHVDAHFVLFARPKFTVQLAHKDLFP
jgi:hypothetical protein